MTGLLPRATWRLLRRGPQPGRYASEFGAHVSLVRRLRCAGWTPEKIARELEDDANAGGDYYRGRLTSRHDGRRAFHKYIVAHCDRQDHDDRTSPRRRPEQADVYEVTQQVRSYAAATLTGRTRSSDLAAVDAWCVIALRHRTTKPLMAVRDLKLGMGVASLQTAHGALKRLQAAGILVAAGPVRPGSTVRNASIS